MANLPVKDLTAGANEYLNYCKQMQEKANIEPTYITASTYRPPPSGEPPIKKGRVSRQQAPPLETNDESELRITGVRVLREWIDFSELDVTKHAPPTYHGNVKTSEKTLNDDRQKNDDGERQTDIAPVGAKVTEIAENVIGAETEAEAESEDWADINVKEEELVEGTNEEEEEKEDSNEGEEKNEKNGKKKMYKCKQCSYKTIWSSNLNKHVVSRHQTSDEIKWYLCEHCPYKGKTREYLRNHQSQCHEPFMTWYQCPHCPKKFNNSQTFKSHKTLHLSPDQINWFKCKLCTMKFKSNTTLKDHVTCKHTHPMDIKWFRCDQCHFKAKIKGQLRKHKVNRHLHRLSNDFIDCDYCDYGAMGYNTILKHVKEKHPELFKAERT